MTLFDIFIRKGTFLLKNVSNKYKIAYLSYLHQNLPYMRILTLLTLILFTSSSAFSQLVLVNSPADVAGSYDFSERADEWGANLLDSIWTGDAVLMDDGVDPNSDGCTPTTNDYKDKMVFVDRGACSFSLKAYHAELAGAVGCIIINNAPGGGLVGMLGGDSAALVTIPVAFITFEDGLILKDAIANGTVNVTIGNVVFDNDVNITQSSTLKPFTGTIPASQVASGNFAFNPVASITNTGLVDASNVMATADITFEGTNIYSEASDTTILPVDSVVALGFPEFDLPNADLGRYEITYNISTDSTDGLPNDNTVTQTFDVVEGALARGSWDFDNNRPFVSFNTTIADGGPIEFYQGVRFPEGGAEGYQLDSVTFRIGTDQPSLDGESITATLYSWDDANTNGVVDDMELSLAAIASKVFDATATAEEWVTVEMLDATTGGTLVFDPAAQYWIGVKYLGVNTVTIGFDATYDNLLALDGFANSFMDFPYLILNDFPDGINGNLADLGSFTDFGNTLAIGYYIQPFMTSSTEEVALDATVNVYPNPASDVLFADIKLDEVAEVLNYTILDIDGKVLYSMETQNVDEYLAKFDVSELASGTYYLRLNDGNKVQTQSFVVVK